LLAHRLWTQDRLLPTSFIWSGRIERRMGGQRDDFPVRSPTIEEEGSDVDSTESDEESNAESHPRPCRYHYVGCQIMIKGSMDDERNHMEANQQEHLKLLEEAVALQASIIAELESSLLEAQTAAKPPPHLPPPPITPESPLMAPSKAPLISSPTSPAVSWGEAFSSWLGMAILSVADLTGQVPALHDCLAPRKAKERAQELRVWEILYAFVFFFLLLCYLSLLWMGRYFKPFQLLPLVMYGIMVSIHSSYSPKWSSTANTAAALTVICTWAFFCMLLPVF